MLTLITCPSCDAAYRVPAESLGDGRKVRCQRCRAEWFAEGAAPAEAEALAPEEPEALSPAPILSLDEASGIDVFERPEISKPSAVEVAPRRSAFGGLRRRVARFSGRKDAAARKSRPIGRPRPSAVAVAVGVAAIGVLVGSRVEIVRAAPSLASLYDAVGLPVNVRGLEIRDLRSAEEVAEGAPVLVVTGLVENVSRSEREVPRLRLAVTAQGGREVYAWTTVAARPKLQPGDTATFRARLASPPAEGRAISVRFLAKRDLMATAGH